MDAVVNHKVKENDWSAVEDHVNEIRAAGPTGEKLMAKLRRVNFKRVKKVEVDARSMVQSLFSKKPAR